MQHTNKRLMNAVITGLSPLDRNAYIVERTGSTWSLNQKSIEVSPETTIDPKQESKQETSPNSNTKTISRKEKTMNKRSNVLRTITAGTALLAISLVSGFSPALASEHQNQWESRLGIYSEANLPTESSSTSEKAPSTPANEELAERIAQLLQQEDYEQALELANEAIETDQSNPAYFYLRAMAKFYNRQSLNLVMPDLDRAIELDGNYVEAITGRALLYQQMNDYKKAARDLDRVLELQPDNFDMLELRMTLHEELKDYAGLIADFSRVISSYPDEAQAFYWRAIYKAKLDDKQGALSDLRMAESILKAQNDENGLSIVREEIASIESSIAMG
ncbi:MAG: tetratricopeptide repeat protein [Cyanobacteria bacterium HKST-UBA02]|nr:tetratricopeptide repeat protein [Cyanobacteria bacterium HKST-UBA02]